MNTDNINSIFKDYLKTDKTQFAILVNGAWGSGKTYFWKYNLNKIAEADGFKTIYISLNGISKIDALEHLLFIKLLPFIANQENKTVKNATTLVTNILNQVSKHFLKSSLTDIFQNLSVDTFNFSKYLICFDDLERCQIPVKEVLGFINNYVEHKNLKTIILADEGNIDILQKDYDNIKEKVIGRVLNFQLNIEETLPVLFKEYDFNNKDFYRFLVKYEKVIVEILTEYKQTNLRIISFYISVLEKAFPCLLNVEEQYIQEVILFSALITIEFKNGNLKSSDFNNSNGLELLDERYYSLNLAQTMRKKEQGEEREKTYADIFYETYLNNRIQNYFYYQSLYTYILSGYMEPSALQSEIEKRYPEIIPYQTQCFRELLKYKFRELTDNQFLTLTKDVLTFAEEGKYSIYEYIQIANFFYFFSNNKMIEESIEDVNKIILGGLEISKLRKEINDRILDNLSHFAEANPEVEKIKDIVKNIHFEIKKEQLSRNGSELIDCIKNKDEIELATI
ncbi:MAG: hypothetical protein JWR09_3277, partial [Mucilaginibacter sp.]|nr:hypothetical protein [Mucilaginibacter sp.]